MLYSNGTVKQIYCHYDGYLSNNGRILLEKYDNAEAVNKLLGYGFVRSLCEDGGVPDVLRDEIPAKEYASYVQFVKEYNPEEYNYLFDENKNQWYVQYERYDNNEKFIELSLSMTQRKA
jgi:hypothetical protein